MFKRALSLFIFLFICNASSVAQKDSMPKNYLSVNLASGLISGEVGLYYDHKLSGKWAVQLSYCHRFYSFNIVSNGGGGGDFAIVPQEGDIIRFGLKSFFRSKYDPAHFRNVYFIYRLSFWNMHTPIYTKSDGSNGLSRTYREVVSEDKYVGNAAFGIGREIHFRSHLFIDTFASFGISAGKKKTHEYSDDHGQIYPANTFVYGVSVFPTVELGLKIGFGW